MLSPKLEAWLNSPNFMEYRFNPTHVRIQLILQQRKKNKYERAGYAQPL